MSPPPPSKGYGQHAQHEGGPVRADDKRTARIAAGEVMHRRSGTSTRGLASGAAFVPTLHSGSTVRIALCVPTHGREGIWAPSCLACAELAVTEVNATTGIAGRPCDVLTVAASDDSPDIEDTLVELVENGDVDALVGMHLSSVRQRISASVGGRLPYVFTSLYEGGDRTPGLYAIGETAQRQLRPSITWLMANRRPMRWALVGNDFVWPRVSHNIARQCINSCGGSVQTEIYVPLGTSDYTQVFDTLRSTRSEAILLSLIGQDAVDFNRAFAQDGLQGSVLRLSCAIEENQLLAIGADGCDDLHVAMGYFAALDTDANGAFKERYHSHFGDRAPTLNSIGQSLYEGIHFLAALLNDKHGGPPMGRNRQPMAYRSARGALRFGNGVSSAPMYLARAHGHHFRVIARI